MAYLGGGSWGNPVSPTGTVSPTAKREKLTSTALHASYIASAGSTVAYISPPVSPKSQEREVLGAQAGLAGAVVTEVGGELGEVEAVVARGYWEQVWRRFRRDKVAIGGGVFIILLFLFAFGGAPLAQRLLHHGPNDVFTAQALNKTTQLPLGPWSHIQSAPGGLDCIKGL